MCLIFISLHQHPRYKLIVAANRDEFYERRTAPAAFWKDHPDILGGRDLQAMGTWMGISGTGRISMITNYRDLSHILAQAPSRGELVSDYLLGATPPDEYLKGVEGNGKMYNGYNLLVGTPDELFYLSNYKKGVTTLKTGFFGLSNHLLDTPWPKVTRGKEKFKPLFEKDEIDPKVLLDALYDEQRALDVNLPDTGVGLERERMLSSMFIKSENYGTRCSTVLLIDKSNEALFTERRYSLKDFTFQTRVFRLTIPGSTEK